MIILVRHTGSKTNICPLQTWLSYASVIASIHSRNLIRQTQPTGLGGFLPSSSALQIHVAGTYAVTSYMSSGVRIASASAVSGKLRQQPLLRTLILLLCFFFAPAPGACPDNRVCFRTDLHPDLSKSTVVPSLPLLLSRHRETLHPGPALDN